VEEAQAIAERSAARAAARDGQVPYQHWRQHGSEGKLGGACKLLRLLLFYLSLLVAEDKAHSSFCLVPDHICLLHIVGSGN
jgi:hypothetical protein